MNNKRTILLVGIIIALIIITIIIAIMFIKTDGEDVTQTNTEISNMQEDNTIDDENIVEDDFVEENLPKISEKGEITNERAIYTDEEGKKAVIPAGYAVIEDSTPISSGLVISDIADDDMENSKGGNQFVWIPVEDTFLDVSTCETEDAINDKIQEEVDNGNYPMAIRLSDGNYAAVLYKFESIKENTAIKVIPIEYGTSEINKEPSNLSEEIAANWTKYKYQEEFNNLIKKVRNDKGFWVGRFETSIDSNGTAQSKKGQVVLTNQSWYDLYETEKTLSKNGATSHMIWSCQWDQIMLWIKDTKNSNATTNPFFILDSTGGGNYSDTQIADETGKIVKKKGQSIRFTSGITEAFQIKNIYDLAGNVFEWTMESWYSAARVVRGGYCSYSSTEYPISSRFHFPVTYTGEHIQNIGSRMTIY